MSFSAINIPFFWHSTIFWNKSPSSAYSITILIILIHFYHKLYDVSSRNASLYCITFACLTLANILTSFNAFYFSLSDKDYSFTFFKAYSKPSAILLTLYTFEYAPSPNNQIHNTQFLKDLEIFYRHYFTIKIYIINFIYLLSFLLENLFYSYLANLSLIHF